MSIDRRIVSILYHNGITDVNDVQEFIGEKNNYYEIKINNEIKKLKIPGYSYDENLVEDLIQKLGELGAVLNDITELNPKTEEEKKLIKEIDDEFNKLESFSKKLKVEEPVVEEPKKEVKKEVKKVVKPKKETKKTDDDIDDFINLA